jgi:hypothetical protein
MSTRLFEAFKEIGVTGVNEVIGVLAISHTGGGTFTFIYYLLLLSTRIFEAFTKI